MSLACMKLEMYTFSRVMFWIDSFFSIDEVKSKKKRARGSPLLEFIIAKCLWGTRRLRVVPHFSSGIVERAKREGAWKSSHARKCDTRRGERKMRDYRQSPSFWPFTADWFWSVKFVSPSKSIKRIQWHPFPYWVVIALVIGKLRGMFIASKRKPRYYTNFFTAVSREKLDSVGNTRLLIMPKCCLFQ